MRQQYLEAMGIQRWVSRDVSPVEAEEVPIPPLEESHAVVEAAVQQPSVLEPDIGVLDWDALRQRVAGCELCPELVANRSQTVFGVGNPEAELLLIGEAPGADEDQQGEPFVGRAGKLLNNMLQSIGLQRQTVYIANILKCRPPNNRDPRPEEALHCEAYLKRQIALIRPSLIMVVGRIAAQNLLKCDTPIGKLRGRMHYYESEAGRIPVVVTYHPAYLLRSPGEKRKAWEDLKMAFHLLGDNRP